MARRWLPGTNPTAAAASNGNKTMINNQSIS
jgi:hypothetical protein